MVAVFKPMAKRKIVTDPRRRIVCRLQDFMDREEGLTQETLATETGLAISTVGLYARNQFNRIDVLTAEVFCDRFQCDMCDMFPLVEK